MAARITLVVHQFLPRYFTGTEQYVFAIARTMQSRGHEVEVIALEPDFSEQDRLYEETLEVVEGLRVLRIRAWYHLDRDFERMEFSHPYVGARIAARLAETRPDVVHFFHLRYLGVEVITEARSLGLRTVVHLMDFWYLCPAVVLRRPDGALCEGPPEGGLGCVDCHRPDLGADLDRRDLREAMARTMASMPSRTRPGTGVTHRTETLATRPRRMRQALLAADRIVAPSRFLRAMFVQNGFPGDRIEVLTYGVDPDRLVGAEARATPGVRSLRLAFFGSIAEHKGADLVVDAVLGSEVDVTLTIHGRTTDFPEFAPALVERAAHDPRVRFPGPFERDRLGQVLAETDVLVVPSRWYENTPFVILEAFAAGVPVIATDLGGLREIVEDEVHGDLFPVGDVDALRSRIERLAREPERLARYRAALPRVKTLGDNADEIAAVYRELGAPT